MPAITDWLMVGITLVYVVATIAIYKSNKDSAKATRDQVNVSVEQIGVLQKQIKQSTNLQLFDRRLDSLKSFECENAFSEHEPLLDILFPDYIVSIEAEILQILKLRQGILMSFFQNAHHLRLQGFSSEFYSKANGLNSSISDVQHFIAPIKKPANEAIAPSGAPFLAMEESQRMETEAIEYTKEIEKLKQEFFTQARNFIAKSIE